MNCEPGCVEQTEPAGLTAFTGWLMFSFKLVKALLSLPQNLMRPNRQTVLVGNVSQMLRTSRESTRTGNLPLCLVPSKCIKWTPPSRPKNSFFLSFWKEIWHLVGSVFRGEPKWKIGNKNQQESTRINKQHQMAWLKASEEYLKVKRYWRQQGLQK